MVGMHVPWSVLTMSHGPPSTVALGDCGHRTVASSRSRWLEPLAQIPGQGLTPQFMKIQAQTHALPSDSGPEPQAHKHREPEAPRSFSTPRQSLTRKQNLSGFSRPARGLSVCSMRMQFCSGSWFGFGKLLQRVQRIFFLSLFLLGIFPKGCPSRWQSSIILQVTRRSYSRFRDSQATKAVVASFLPHLPGEPACHLRMHVRERLLLHQSWL